MDLNPSYHCFNTERSDYYALLKKQNKQVQIFREKSKQMTMLDKLYIKM